MPLFFGNPCEAPRRYPRTQTVALYTDPAFDPFAEDLRCSCFVTRGRLVKMCGHLKLFWPGLPVLRGRLGFTLQSTVRALSLEGERAVRETWLPVPSLPC